MPYLSPSGVGPGPPPTTFLPFLGSGAVIPVRPSVREPLGRLWRAGASAVCRHAAFAAAPSEAASPSLPLQPQRPAGLCRGGGLGVESSFSFTT